MIILPTIISSNSKELIAISLDAYRNRMLRMNLYLSIAGIGIGTSTAVAGFYGMNLISGLEESPNAFGYVVGTTTTLGMIIGAGCISYISGSSMRKRTLKRLNEITLIDGSLAHMTSIDYAIKYMVHKNQTMNKQEFEARLKECHSSTQLLKEEVDLLFHTLDVTKDGLIYTDDFERPTHGHVESERIQQKIEDEH